MVHKRNKRINKKTQVKKIKSKIVVEKIPFVKVVFESISEEDIDTALQFVLVGADMKLGDNVVKWLCDICKTMYQGMECQSIIDSLPSGSEFQHLAVHACNLGKSQLMPMKSLMIWLLSEMLEAGRDMAIIKSHGWREITLYDVLCAIKNDNDLNHIFGHLII